MGGRMICGFAAFVLATGAWTGISVGDKPGPRPVIKPPVPVPLRPVRPIAPIGPIGPRRPAAKADLFGACNRGDIVLIGTLVSADAFMQTMSMPPTVVMRVTLKEVAALRGTAPDTLTWQHSRVKGTGPALTPGKKYIVVAGRAKPRADVRITDLFPATAENVKKAKAAQALPLGWTLDATGRPVSPWTALGDKAWPKGVSHSGLAADRTCAVTGRPALMAGPGITLTVDQVPPTVRKKYRNPFGDGKFTVTVTNTTDAAVDVPALLTDGKTVFWADSLFVIVRKKVHLLPGAGRLTKDVRPVRLEPGKSATTVIDTLPIAGISWPRGGSRVRFLFCLGEKSASNFFYYYSKHHDALRKRAISRLKS